VTSSRIGNAADACPPPRHRKRYAASIEKTASNHALLEQFYGEMDFYRARKAAHIKILRELVKPFRQDERCLKTLPGVGFIGACTLIAYLESGWRWRTSADFGRTAGWEYESTSRMEPVIGGLRARATATSRRS